MSSFKTIISSVYLSSRFYYSGLAVVFVFAASFFVPVLFSLAQLMLVALIIFTLFDALILYRNMQGMTAVREVPEKLSNGDENDIKITIQNHYGYDVRASVIDELPQEFQIRDFEVKRLLKSGHTETIIYHLRPVFRGEIQWGSLYVKTSTPVGLVIRNYKFNQNQEAAVYPSFIQLKKYELLSFSQKLHRYGIKKIRKIGHTMEFEKIKDYIPGDDFRTVNWKATAKAGKLMVNQYQDEKSQPVYCIIDRGRMMKLPFNGLSLLDYAINASLVICDLVLRKQDYAGMFSFSRKVENRVKADRRGLQMTKIIEALYNVKTDFFESHYGRLYADISQNIPQRSLLLLFTNFETMDGLNRQLPYLKAISRSHLLIVIFFQNTELEHITQYPANNVREVYDKIVAEKFIYEKKLIVSELKKYGIQSILTKPENLTIDTINKYLEVKARGMF